MKLFKSLIIAIVLSVLAASSASAFNFSSAIEQGFLKQNSIKTEHFRIEFSNLIKNQPDSDGDGIADLIENTAEYSEISWDVIVDDLGYDSPIATDKRVIIVLDDRNTYIFPGSVGVTTTLSDAITPLIAVDPWQPDEVLKVTLAHEMYHAVQFGYDASFASSNNSVNFAEATAVWIEDVVFDAVNDYYLYLIDFFDYPDYSVFAGISPEGSLYPYALTVWPTFLAEFYEDEDIMKDIWLDYFDSALSNNNAAKVFSSVRKIVENRGDDLYEIYREFSYWNLENSNYSEGNNFPDVFVLEEGIPGEYVQINEEYSPALYGSNYHFYENTSGDDEFYFHIIKGEDADFIVSIVPFDNGDVEFENVRTVSVNAEDEMNQELFLDGLSTKDGVFAIVSTFDDNVNPNTAATDVFDLGSIYLYAGDYGMTVLDGEEFVLDGTSKKEGEVIDSDGIRVQNSLAVSVITYDEDSVTLSWNRLNDSRIAGYEILYGTESGVYDEVEEVAQEYITSRTVRDLEEELLYFFQVIAVDQNGNQVGDESSEIAVIPMEWIFTDVSYLDTHFDSISSLTEEGIFAGNPDGSFAPNAGINRAELLKILIEGSDFTPSVFEYNNCFPDVNREWFAPYICYALDQGMIQGYPDGTFKPANIVNKVEALKMLFTVVGEGYENLHEGTPVSRLVFPDLDRTAWYAIYIWRASNLGILEETPVEDFHPDLGRARGEMAEELYRYLLALEMEIIELFEQTRLFSASM